MSDVARQQAKRIASKFKASIQQQLEDALKSLSNSKGEELQRDLGEFTVSLVIKRVIDGYDINSQKFKATKYKGRAKSNAYKRARCKTKYASSSKSDHLRLSGKLLSSVYVRDIKVIVNSKGITVSVTTDVPNKFKKQVEGLASNRTSRGGKSKARREFLGLAKSGSYKNRETSQLTQFLIEWLRNNGFNINNYK